MLGQCHRHWAKIKTALAQRLVYAGWPSLITIQQDYISSGAPAPN